MKIFMGLVEIAGYYSNLKKGFEQLGIDSVFVDLGNYPFKRQNLIEYDCVLVKIVKYVHKKSDKYFCCSRSLIRLFWIYMSAISKVILFLWALLKYDVFIFGNNSTFFRYYDLPILKLLKKKIIYVFHGSDSRPPYLDGLFITTNKNLATNDIIVLTIKKKNILMKIEKYADYIINNPSQAFFHKKPFILWLIIGIPFEDANGYEGSFLSDQLNILHAPSRPEDKGSMAIEGIINSLIKKGHKLNFIKISNMPNNVVIDNLRKCDFIIDQMYSDTPMATLATEAAFFGKPAVVGGYYVKYIRDDIPLKYIPPSYYCHPDEVEQAIEKMIMDTAYRLELGDKVKGFVRSKWLPKQVAERYLRMINNDVPKEWLYDPNKINYIFGSFMPEEKTKKIISDILDAGGIKALCLYDKLNIEKKVLDFLKN